MPSSESEGQPPPKKRSRKTSAGGEESGVAGKKARGRPRVDTHDATAADRRRTQIRLAQRAYRQRKETTISSLKDQNTRLQNIIAEMNKSFLQFNDSAVKSGLLHVNPILAQQLKQVMENFVALAKSASECEGEDSGAEQTKDVAAEGQIASPGREPVQDRPPQSAPPSLQRFGWGYSEHTTDMDVTSSAQHHQKSTSSFEHGHAEQSTLVRYRPPITTGHLMDQGGRAWNDPTTEEQPSSQALPFGLVDILSQQQYSEPGTQPRIYSVNIPSPEITPPYTRLPTPPHLPSLSLKAPKPSWTYSHDETTFARRLTRAALESAFHLISNVNQRPAAVSYVFKLSLPYSSVHELRDNLKVLLARGVDEDLDNWVTPFLHLGGAGTHYPRKDAQGNYVKIPNAWTVRRIGPLTSNMIRAENVDDPTKSHELDLDLTGFEGEWFDAYDVEGYLEHVKGVRIDPRSSFAEAVIDDDSASEAPGLSVEASDDVDGFDHERTRGSVSSATPSFATGTVSTPSSTTSAQSAGLASSNPMDGLFGQSNAPFGLDMGPSLRTFTTPTDFTKMSGMDPTSFFDQPLGLDLAPGFGLPFGLNPQSTLPQVNFDNGGIDMGALGLDLLGASSMQLPVVRQKKKIPALVDVSKLVNGIITHGVCLGRAPGFRRKDVDMAFEAALITTF